MRKTKEAISVPRHLLKAAMPVTPDFDPPIPVGRPV